MTRLLQRLLRREPPLPRHRAPLRRAGAGRRRECTACGWDLRESYHGPVGRHEDTEPEPSRGP